MSAIVKELLKSDSICQSYVQIKMGPAFSDSQCSFKYKTCSDINITSCSTSCQTTAVVNRARPSTVANSATIKTLLTITVGCTGNTCGMTAKGAVLHI